MPSDSVQFTFHWAKPGSVIQRIGNRKRYINATELVSAVQQLSAHLVEGLEPVEVKE